MCILSAKLWDVVVNPRRSIRQLSHMYLMAQITKKIQVLDRMEKTIVGSHLRCYASAAAISIPKPLPNDADHETFKHKRSVFLVHDVAKRDRNCASDANLVEKLHMAGCVLSMTQCPQ
jgi:hypothetical protein